MKKPVLFLFGILLTALVNFSSAQDLQEVLEKHFKAIGQEALLKKETYHIQATVQQMGMEIPMEMKMKRPGKFRMEMEMQGQKMIQVYNGEKGWVLAPWISSEARDLTGPELRQAMDQADIDGELYHFEERGFSAELLGKEFLDDDEVYNIKLTNSEGGEKNYYIDTKQYLIRKVRARVNVQGTEMAIEQTLSDYTEIDGVKMAMKITSKSPAGTGNIIFNRVQFGEDFDDSLFSRPGKKVE